LSSVAEGGLRRIRNESSSITGSFNFNAMVPEKTPTRQTMFISVDDTSLIMRDSKTMGVDTSAPSNEEVGNSQSDTQFAKFADIKEIYRLRNDTGKNNFKSSKFWVLLASTTTLITIVYICYAVLEILAYQTWQLTGAATSKFNVHWDLYTSLYFSIDIFFTIKLADFYTNSRYFFSRWQYHMVSWLPLVAFMDLLGIPGMNYPRNGEPCNPNVAIVSAISLVFRLPFLTSSIDRFPWFGISQDANMNFVIVTCFTFCKIVAVSLMLCHIFAAIYIPFAEWEYHAAMVPFDYDLTWERAATGDFYARYELATHWAASSLFVGAMEPTTASRPERRIQDLSFFCNIVFVGQIIARLSVLAQSMMDNEEALRSIRNIGKTLQMHNVPKHTEKRIKKFLKKRAQRITFFECMETLENTLSTPLYNEFRYMLHGKPYIRKFRAFFEYGDAFIIGLSDILQQNLRSEEDFVFCQGYRASEMVFLIDGSLGAYKMNSTDSTKGESESHHFPSQSDSEDGYSCEVFPAWHAFVWLGEKCIFHTAPVFRQLNVVCLTFCEIILLTQEDFREKVSQFPRWEQLYDRQCEQLERATQDNDNTMLANLFGCALCKEWDHYTLDCLMQRAGGDERASKKILKSFARRIGTLAPNIQSKNGIDTILYSERSMAQLGNSMSIRSVIGSVRRTQPLSSAATRDSGSGRESQDLRTSHLSVGQRDSIPEEDLNSPGVSRETEIINGETNGPTVNVPGDEMSRITVGDEELMTAREELRASNGVEKHVKYSLDT